MSNSEITNPAPRAFATCTVATDSGPLTVPCEPVGDDLAITPVFGMDDEGRSRLGGDFVITHLGTGTAVSDGPGCIECCRSAGKALLDTGVDWSALTIENRAEIMSTWSDELRRAVAEARTVNWSCDAEYCDPWPDGAAEAQGEARSEHLEKVGVDDDGPGPSVQICKPGQVAATSKALGIPVSRDDPNDPYHHAKCGGCGGTKTDDECPFSVRIRQHGERFQQTTGSGREN